jgi:hypothetical protein
MNTTLPELITFSLSRTTVEVSHVAAGEHMVPGPFHLLCFSEEIHVSPFEFVFFLLKLLKTCSEEGITLTVMEVF